MAEFDPETLQVPERLAAAVDLDPRAVLAVIGSGEAPTGFLTALPEVEPERLLEIWRNALGRVAPVGFRPVLFEPMGEPGAHDLLHDEPRVLDPLRGLSLTASTAERNDEQGMPVYRSADEMLAAAGSNDIEQTLITPDDDMDPDTLVDLDVPADELIQLPAGPTARVDYAVQAENAEGAAPADLFLAYVQAADPGEALARLYLGDYRSPRGNVGETLAILRTWHERYGAELLQVKAETGTLELWVDRQPDSTEACVRLGREVHAFWPQVKTLWERGDNPGRVGRRLAGSRVWRFPG